MNGLRPIGGAPIASLGQSTETFVRGITDYRLGRQEQPFHPRGWALPGIQGPDVARPSEIGSIWGKQEQPFHPGSYLKNSIHFHRPPGTDFFFGRQENPRGYDHPQSLFWDPNEFDDPDPVTGGFIGHQEQPDQTYLFSKPPMHSGGSTANEVLKIYIIG